MSVTLDITKNLGNFHLAIQLQTKGGVVGLLGASGSGKSKTLQCISGIERPDTGKIILNETTFFDATAHVNMPIQQRRVGYLFQHYALFPNMTVAENIACGIWQKASRSDKKERIASMVKRLHLQGLEGRKPAELSGGQQQRVALGRILVNEPDMLLLDEPFSALDSFLKGQVMAELQDVIAQFQKDVFVVTHSRDEAYQLCDTLAVLDQGHVEIVGKTADVFAQPKTKAAATLLGCSNMADAVKRGDHTGYVPSWDVMLTTSEPVADGLCAIGVRSHAFSMTEEENQFPITVVEQQERPFAYTLAFRYAAQRADAPLLWMTVAKRDYDGAPTKLGISPKDILLLYR